jgi:hypothetical protein
MVGLHGRAAVQLDVALIQREHPAISVIHEGEQAHSTTLTPPDTKVVGRVTSKHVFHPNRDYV